MLVESESSSRAYVCLGGLRGSTATSSLVMYNKTNYNQQQFNRGWPEKHSPQTDGEHDSSSVDSPLMVVQSAKFLPTKHDLDRTRLPRQLHEDQLPHRPHSGVSATMKEIQCQNYDKGNFQLTCVKFEKRRQGDSLIERRKIGRQLPEAKCTRNTQG